jgi:hypothetical protein
LKANTDSKRGLFCACNVAFARLKPGELQKMKRGIKQMFICAYLGMSALVAGYFVVMYKIFY